MSTLNATELIAKLTSLSKVGFNIVWKLKGLQHEEMLVPVKAEDRHQVKEVKNKLYCGHGSESKDAPHL